MSDANLSDRELVPRPRTEEVISDKVRRAIVNLIDARIDDGSIDWRYPDPRPDGCATEALSSEAFDMGSLLFLEIYYIVVFGGAGIDPMSSIYLSHGGYRGTKRRIELEFSVSSDASNKRVMPRV